MSRKELALDLSQAFAERNTSKEGWDRLYQSPEFLNCVTAIHRRRLDLLAMAAGDHIEMARRVWMAEGMREALQQIEVTEMAATKRRTNPLRPVEER